MDDVSINKMSKRESVSLALLSLRVVDTMSSHSDEIKI